MDPREETVMAIDFTLSESQRSLQADARAFARTVLSEVRSIIEPFPRPEERFFATQPIYEQMAKAGFVHALFPKEYAARIHSVSQLNSRISAVPRGSLLLVRT